MKHAPPAKTVDGLFAVPISIESIEASMLFDAATAKATATSTMTFRLGPTAGCPIFDLRQTIASAELDGTVIAPSQLAHHTFVNSQPTGKLRVINQQLPANSLHTLVLNYSLDTPDAPGAQRIGWRSNPAGVVWDFWFSDLNPGRYLEMWLPCNLVFDESPLTLNLQLVNAAGDHTLITTGAATTQGQNHWLIIFPNNTSSFSPMLYLAPSNTLEHHTSTVTPPAHNPITIELYKPVSLNENLAVCANTIATNITKFVNNTGRYLHGTRFTALLWSSRSMEYNGGTTSSKGALVHELFHSWYARGLKPATQNDGWLDEAWTTYVTDAGGSQPFNMDEEPVELCSQEPYNRITPRPSYSRGRRFFRGLAAELGIAGLYTMMRNFYEAYAGLGVSTEEFQEFVIAHTGRIEFADFFHRFIYGFSTPISAPDLYLKDAPDDYGSVPYSGVFWRSPDVWVRQNDDDSDSHQDPEYGQDNWFHARVRNRSSQTARSFVVSFTFKPFLGTQFVYPQDWGPFMGVAVGFDLAEGETRIVKARWPSAMVPPARTHGCLLAHVYTPDDPGSLGAHVWEDNNLAQRNLTIVDLLPNQSTDTPLRIGSMFANRDSHGTLEVLQPTHARAIPITFLHANPRVLIELFRRPSTGAPPPGPLSTPVVRFAQPTRLTVGALANPLAINVAAGSSFYNVEPEMNTSRSGLSCTPPQDKDLAMLAPQLLDSGRALVLPTGRMEVLPIELSARRPADVSIRIQAPANARPGQLYDVDIKHRNDDGIVVGGVTIRMRIRHQRG